jgi:hypothetical protein
VGYVAGDDPAPTEVTMHSSWRGLFASLLGAILVTIGGLVGVAVGGWRFFPTLILIVGLGFVLVVLFDYPVATTFSAAGVRRRMMLRVQSWPWERISQFTRVRPGVTKGFRGLSHGGLAALVGKRRYLLLDQPESPEEFDVLYRLAGDRVEELGLRGRIRPRDGTTPTWLYRRAKWAPDEVKRR